MYVQVDLVDAYIQNSFGYPKYVLDMLFIQYTLRNRCCEIFRSHRPVDPLTPYVPLGILTPH